MFIPLKRSPMFFFLLVLEACLEKKQVSVRGGGQISSLTWESLFCLGYRFESGSLLALMVQLLLL